MQTWRPWAALGVAVGILGAVSSIPKPEQAPRTELRAALGRVSPTRALEPSGPDLDGLDLSRLELRDDRIESPLPGGRRAELTLDPRLQESAIELLDRYAPPEAGVVLMNVKTGELYVYASHVAAGEPFDVNARAEAPAASIFKLVTAAALLERPSMSSQTEQCYHGGHSRIELDELREDPARDRWCASLAMAMGKSINVVFARLAQRLLTPEGLTRTAAAFGFGAPTPFEVPTEAPLAELPSEPLEFARAAAGFWHTTLSPLAAASIAQTVASGGVTYKPRVVRAIIDGEDTVWRAPREPLALRRAMPASAAHELTRMMLQTVASGSAYKAFRGPKGAPYLPHIAVAGKTGTLSRHAADRHYTWFVGFAPADKPEVAVAALVVNTAIWRLKGPYLGRDMLRAYFAARDYPGVTAP